MSQNSRASTSSGGNVEIVDLTDETFTNNDITVIKNSPRKIIHNQTITIDDSFAPLVDENENENVDNHKSSQDDNYLPYPSPVHIPHDESSNDSLPSRITLSSKTTSQSSDTPKILSQTPASTTTNNNDNNNCNNNLDINPLDEFLNYSSPANSCPASPQASSSTKSTPVKQDSSMKKKKLKTSSTPKLLTKSAMQIQKRLEREEAKRVKMVEKERDKLEKEANRANAANKALDNCTANVHSNILKLINDPEEITLKTLFDESMIIYRLEDNPTIENSISWTYKRTEIVDGNCVVKFNNSKWLMVVMAGSDYLKQLLIYKQNPEDINSIKTFLTKLRSHSQCDIVLIVYNLANHLKIERAKEAKNYRKTFKDKFEGRTGATSSTAPETTSATDAQASSAIGTTELQDLRLTLEMELKHQFRDWKLHLEFYEKTADVIQTFVRYTSSMAKLQVKQKIRSSTGLDWAINMDKERAVDPTKSSDDLTKLWITQLQQFSQVTLPIAKAIAAEYPSPCALLDQYKNLTESEAEDLLGELYIQRNLKRQIGPNISRRIHCFMTCKEPDVHIGLS